MVEHAAGERLALERADELLEAAPDDERQAAHAAAHLGQDVECAWEAAVVAEVESLEAANGRGGLQQVAAVAVDVDDPAVEVAQDALDGRPPPSLEVIHRRHVERVYALADDAARDPLHHVAARAALDEHPCLEEALLHQHVEREGEVDGAADHVGRVNEGHVGRRGAEELEDEVQAVNQDEVADAELAGPAVPQHGEQAAEAPKRLALGLDAERLEPRPVTQQRRDHRRDPAAVGMRHVLDLPADDAAIEALVALAEVGGRDAVVEHRCLAAQMLVPEGQPLGRLGALAVAVGVACGKCLDRGARRLHHRKHPVESAALIQRAEPLGDVVEVGAIGEGARGSHHSCLRRSVRTVISGGQRTRIGMYCVPMPALMYIWVPPSTKCPRS